jgi:hypothetical protein
MLMVSRLNKELYNDLFDKALDEYFTVYHDKNNSPMVETSKAFDYAVNTAKQRYKLIRKKERQNDK